MSRFEVAVEFMDGQVSQFFGITDLTVTDGQLHLNERKQFSGQTVHCGSFPLTNIRKWQKVEP